MKGEITIFAIFVFFVSFFSMEGWATDWMFFTAAGGGSEFHYYDPQSITWVSKDIVRVREKMNFTEKSVQDMVKAHGPGYKALSYAISLWEFNCSEKKWRFLAFTFYEQGGSVISDVNNPSPWDLIIPKSVFENLCNIVCNNH